MNKMVPFVLFLIILVGCTTTRINQFNQFAEAGKAYADAVEIVTEEAGKAAIEVDSAVLIKIRDNIEYEDRVNTIVEHNELLKERLQLLRSIRHHAKVLKSYFVALSDLAQSDTPDEIRVAAGGLVESLGTISEEIRDAKIGNMAVSDFTGPATKIVVAHLRLFALENELKKHSAIIERELDLQQAVLKLIVGQMKTDLSAFLANLESKEIVNKYSIDKKLPGSWAKKRKEILTTIVSLDAADAASDAAKELKQAFVALVENKFEFSHIDAIIMDIEEIYTLINKIITQEQETGEEE